MKLEILTISPLKWIISDSGTMKAMQMKCWSQQNVLMKTVLSHRFLETWSLSKAILEDILL